MTVMHASRAAAARTISVGTQKIKVSEHNCSKLPSHSHKCQRHRNRSTPNKKSIGMYVSGHLLVAARDRSRSDSNAYTSSADDGVGGSTLLLTMAWLNSTSMRMDGAGRLGSPGESVDWHWIE